jgi:hypothetical protein
MAGRLRYEKGLPLSSFLVVRPDAGSNRLLRGSLQLALARCPSFYALVFGTGAHRTQG